MATQDRFETRSPSKSSRRWRRAESRLGVSRGSGQRTADDPPTSSAATRIGESILCCYRSISNATDFVPGGTAHLSNGRTWAGGSCGGPTDVPPGQWGCGIIYYCPITKTVTDPITGEESEEKYPLLKTYTVFSVDQVEGDHLDHLAGEGRRPGEQPDFIDFDPAETGHCCHGGRYSLHRRQGLLPPGRRLHPDAAEERSSPMRPSSTRPAFHELAHWSENRGPNGRATTPRAN